MVQFLAVFQLQEEITLLNWLPRQVEWQYTKSCSSVISCSYRNEIGPYLNEKLCGKYVLV